MFFSVYQFEDIEFYNKHFDESTNLLYLKRLKNNDNYIPYSTDTAYTHHLMESVEFSMLLMRKNTPEALKKAEIILNTVLSFQETHPQSVQCGRFPDYSEDVAQFYQGHTDNATTLKITMLFLQILMNYKPLISSELITKLENACYTTTFYFSLCNNITVYNCSYMHFLEVYILLQCGNMLKKPDFFNYGVINLNTLYSGIQYNGNFWEYGAIYEYYIISETLMLIKRDIDDTNCINMVDTLYDLLWKNISLNFHTDWSILTGPKSDMSKRFEMSYFIGFLEKATSCKLKNSVSSMQDSILSRCPKKHLLHFYNKTPSRFVQQLVSRGSNYFYFTLSQIASNYLRPLYTLGCFNREEFWYGHTPFICYFHSEESPLPYCVKIKVLNNYHDYSSAELHCLQHKGVVLGHIVFSTNRGDLHPDWTPTHGKIITTDFRIRLEVLGNIDKLKITSDNQSLTIKYNSITLQYKIPYIYFDDMPITFEITKKKNHLYFDAVFNLKEEQEINFLEIERAICQFVFHITASEKTLNESKNSFKDGIMISELEYEGLHLQIETPDKPDYFEYLNTHDRQYVNGIRLEQYVAFNQAKAILYKFIVTSNSNLDLPSIDHTDSKLLQLDDFNNIPIKNLNKTASKFFDNLIENNYTLDIFKRYSVHIVMMLFDRAKSENFQFERIINNNYFDIYQKISTAPTVQNVRNLIMDIVIRLQSDYSTLDAQAKKQTIVSDIISIIDKNYQNPFLSLSIVSEMLGLSESYISRSFKNKTNTNYVKYLIRVRMEKAKELLLEGKPIDTVVTQCGYLNIFSFRRAFKLYTGMTVGDWLKQQ